MIKRNRNRIMTLIAVSLLILAAFFCRFLGRNGILPFEMGIIRGVIQAGLLVAWAFSVKNRIINKQVRRLLLLLAVLMILWCIVRTVKFAIPEAWSTLFRYIWYLYYVPLELIPVVAILAGEYLNRPEDYKLPKGYFLLFIPSFALIALIMTNDLHEWAFTDPHLVSDYGRGVIYYAAMGWIFLMAVGYVYILQKRSRLPKNKKRLILPILPICAGLAYVLLYFFAFDFIKPVLGDLVPVTCFIFIFAVEACIATGLIQTNTHYRELFLKSGISAQITDEQYGVFLASDTAVPVARDKMKATENGHVMLDGSIRLSGKDIQNGHVLWTEDMTELAETIAELEDINEDLEGKHTVLQEELETRKKRSRLVEKNRLYNKMQDETAGKLDRLKTLSAQLSNCKNDKEIKAITAELAVLCAYLKRRNNLLFISEENESISFSELIYCIKESLDNIALCGMQTNMHSALVSDLDFNTIKNTYDAFETAAETILHTASELFVTLTENVSSVALRLNTVCTDDLYSLSDCGFTVDNDGENEWTLEFSTPKKTKGGEGL